MSSRVSSQPGVSHLTESLVTGKGSGQHDMEEIWLCQGTRVTGDTCDLKLAAYLLKGTDSNTAPSLTVNGEVQTPSRYLKIIY